MRLRGHFDGKAVMLDQPAPPNLKPNTAVEILIVDERERALQEMTAFLQQLWSRPANATGQPARSWSREELYERR